MLTNDFLEDVFRQPESTARRLILEFIVEQRMMLLIDKIVVENDWDALKLFNELRPFANDEIVTRLVDRVDHLSQRSGAHVNAQRTKRPA